MVKHLISSAIAFFAIAFATTASAQSGDAKQEFGKNEFQVNVGVGAMNYDKNDCGNFAKTKIGDADDYMIYYSFATGYMHNFTDRIGVGADLSFGYGNSNVENNDEKIGDAYQVTVSLLATGRYYWMHKDHFGLYSKVGVGVEYNGKGVSLKDRYKNRNSIKDSDLEGEETTEFGYNVAPIGAEFGNKKFRGFVEPQIANHRVTVNAGAKFVF